MKSHGTLSGGMRLFKHKELQYTSRWHVAL